MFGKNEVAGRDYHTTGSLLVNSIFYTIQGEGPDAGLPAVFVRLAKCNLRCYFCDTDFAQGVRMSVDEIVFKIGKQAGPSCHLVVITGGEPLLQNIAPLCLALGELKIKASVETAGTVCPPDLNYARPQIICSPKTPLLSEQLRPYITAYKYIVDADTIDPDDGLPTLSTQIPGKVDRVYRPSIMERLTVPIYLQPMDVGSREANQRNVEAAAAACMKHGYRLSLQLHKIAGLP